MAVTYVDHTTPGVFSDVVQQNLGTAPISGDVEVIQVLGVAFGDVTGGAPHVSIEDSSTNPIGTHLGTREYYNGTYTFFVEWWDVTGETPDTLDNSNSYNLQWFRITANGITSIDSPQTAEDTGASVSSVSPQIASVAAGSLLLDGCLIFTEDSTLDPDDGQTSMDQSVRNLGGGNRCTGEASYFEQATSGTGNAGYSWTGGSTSALGAVLALEPPGPSAHLTEHSDIDGSVIRASLSEKVNLNAFLLDESVPHYRAEIEMESGSWTNVTDWAQKFNTERTLGSLLKELKAGQATLVLDNHDRRFSPENNAGPYAGKLIPGIRLRSRVTYAGSNHHLFTGFIESYSVNPEIGHRRVQITANDRFQRIKDRKVDVPIRVDTNPGSLFTDVLSAAGVPSDNRSLGGFTEIIPFAWFNNKDADKALKDIVEAVDANIFISGDDVFRARDRYYDVFGTVVASFSNEYLDFDYQFDGQNIINKAIVKAKRRKVRTNIATIAWLEELVSIPASSHVSFFLEYVDPDDVNKKETPAQSITVVSSSDYITNTRTQGTGFDRTSQTSAAVDNLGATAVCTLFNGSSDEVFLTKFQIRGYSLQEQPELRLVTDNTESQSRYGVRDKTFDSPLISGIDYARGLSGYLVNEQGGALSDTDITVVNRFPDMLTVELGDRIGVVENETAVDAIYTVVNIEHSVDFSNGDEHRTTFSLRFWEDRKWFILDDTEHGQLDDDILGF